MGEYEQRSPVSEILALYDNPPADGRVICVDEFGPLNLQPRPGRGWFPRGHPARRRATYTRTAGQRQMFAVLDLASGQLFYRFRHRKRWREFGEICRQLAPLGFLVRRHADVGLTQGASTDRPATATESAGVAQVCP